jgi:CheY-like chemotaxis protein
VSALTPFGREELLVVSSFGSTPAAKTQQEEPRFPDSEANSSTRRVRNPMSDNGKTVLLVEDNEDNRIVYSTILRHFGFSVMEALNGEEGIAKARSERPDLILMDISIPIIDGWEATQVLKHDPLTREIPIIALTAHALASDREKAMEVGCDGYLAKPCEPRAVVAEVQRFLGKDNGR